MHYSCTRLIFCPKMDHSRASSCSSVMWSSSECQVYPGCHRTEANHAIMAGPACPSHARRQKQGGSGSMLFQYFSTDSPGSGSRVSTPMVLKLVMEVQRPFGSQVCHLFHPHSPHLDSCLALPVHPASISFNSRLSLRSWVS